MDAVARESVVFSQVISPVPLTLPAHCSMLTGMTPPYHGVHDNINYRLADSVVTLAELLRGHGFQTAAVIGAFVLDSQSGIGQGFDTFDDQLVPGGAAAGARPERLAGDVTRIANRWLGEHPSSPFFLFLHYFDPHDPYTPPEPFASTFKTSPYDGEIAYTDHAIGQVIEKVKELDLYDSSIIIIVSDHGESLGEHGESTHGYFVYHSTTKVPLVVKLPGHRLAKRVDEKISLVDIVPTVLSRFGLPIPEGLQGQDLSPLLAGDVSGRTPRHIYSESMLATKYGCNSLLAVETSDWKYIQTSKPELYNLTLDPAELDNVLDKQPERAGQLQSTLASMLAEGGRPDEDNSTVAMDPASLARLRTLGYTGGPVRETFEFDTDLDDPKDFIEIHTKLESMGRLEHDKNYDEARRLAEEILAVRPDVVQVHGRLGFIGVRTGDPDLAIKHYGEALRLAPDSDDAALWHNNFGLLMRQQDRVDEAVEHFREAIRLAEPAIEGETRRAGTRDVNRGALALLLSARLSLGEALVQQNKLTEAADQFRQVASIAPGNAMAHYNLSVVLSKLGRADEAAAEYNEAMRLQQAYEAAHQTREQSRRPGQTENQP